MDSTGENYKSEEIIMTVSKSILQVFYSMTSAQKKEFISFLRRELRLEEDRKQTLSDHQEADKPDS